MSWSWTCDPVSGVCTLSSDLVAYATDLLQGVWTLAGAVLALACVLGIVSLFLARVRG